MVMAKVRVDVRVRDRVRVWFEALDVTTKTASCRSIMRENWCFV
jgi:hypothetical protein